MVVLHQLSVLDKLALPASLDPIPGRTRHLQNKIYLQRRINWLISPEQSRYRGAAMHQIKYYLLWHFDYSETKSTKTLV